MCTSAADIATFYDAFDANGLQYGPAYRTVVQGWGGGLNVAIFHFEIFRWN